MGYANDEEEARPSSDAEETLPLYEDVQVDSTAEIKAPDAKATPDEVRDFLVQLMLARGVGIDHARRVSARWTIGTGKELSAYPVAMYRDIFGAEDGWVVYKEVKTLIYAREFKKSKYTKWIPRKLYLFDTLRFSRVVLISRSTGICILVALGWIGACVGIFKSDLSELVKVGAGFSIILDLLFIVIMIAMLSEDRDPESKAEKELQSGWYKVSNNTNQQG